jgi:hypothetical protein
MRVVRRLTGWTFGAAGAVGLVLCVAGLVGCWVAYFEVVGRVDRLFGRAEGALAETGGNLGQVGDRLRGTQAELGAVRRREAEVSSRPPAERGARRALSRKAVEAIGPQATEAALVAKGLLDALAELPVADRVNVDTDGLKEASAQLSDVSERAAKLASLLGPDTGADRDIGTESSRAAEALRRAIALADAGADRWERGRETVAAGHARTRRWTMGAAVAVTAMLVWIAAGQLSLLIHGRTLARR